MIWSVVAGRAVASVAARAVRPPALSAVARRTLFATPQLSFPAAKTSESASKKTADKKEKKASKSEKKKKEKKPKEEKKQQTRVPKELKPPKQAPNPYILFFTSFVKSQPKPNTMQDVQELSKRAADIWKGYSMAEKQPFYDESEARKAQVKQERDEFFRKTSPSDLRKLNSIRKAQKKRKYHITKKTPTALSSFLQFASEFRTSSEGQALMSETPLGQNKLIRAIQAAGERWRSMSPEEKEPYHERYRKEKEELKTGAQ